MRTTAVGVVIGAVLATIVFSIGQSDGNLYAERTINAQPYLRSGATECELDVFHSPDGRQLTVIDLRKRVMSVYSIDPKTHEITLRSVRSFRWDLEMDNYNGTDPKPEKIRSLLQRPS